MSGAGVTTPHFVGRRALILHRPDEAVARLERQLRVIGLEVEQRWAPLRPEERFDVVLVDADQGWNGLLPWPAEEARCPVVALLASEAPGRIAFAIAQGAGALIAKPVNAAAVYPALVLALYIFAERAAARAKIEALQERLRLRGAVLRAVDMIAARHCLDEEEAYRRLRRFAMDRRLTVEQAAASVLAGRSHLPEAG
ncbi:ANTAR domain-containing protein [Ancylobacter sp. 6x-1]|uniref:ANTAR domain-containing protein n=1 Tax=Ancylobacter crimeensis TaxID=2579147 RepID=A0ABT0DDK5_9HYPH|nr:ANTAR domain-containing protein [Ancylobacter crimeensis]MCK0197964.1 ANTAR domain-containing protein [Ancylobacter crimeensis]